MPKKIEEYTDEELERAIKMHESSIEDDKKTLYPNKDLIDATQMKEDYLIKLYKERDIRIKRGNYSPRIG